MIAAVTVNAVCLCFGCAASLAMSAVKSVASMLKPAGMNTHTSLSDTWNPNKFNKL